MVNQQIHNITRKLRVTAGELWFVGSFLVNFMVGKIIHLTSTDEEVYNYYNDKNNIFNQLFVKKGWFWTTILLVAFYGVLLSKSHPKIENKLKFIQLSVLKYIIATGWWILFTQWCFGLPIMDKIFIYTGGKCTNIHPSKVKPHLASVLSKSLTDELQEFYESKIISSSVCRSLRGHWVGGHDPSGHVFLLIHSSLYLFFEISQFWPGWPLVISDMKKLSHDLKLGRFTLHHYIMKNPSILVIWLIGLWWFMLLMTNIYFHSILEKLVGLLFGYAILGLYLIPRFQKYI